MKSKTAIRPNEQTIANAIERGVYFSAGIKLMKRLCVGLTIVLGLAVSLAYYAVVRESRPVYFMANEDGTLVEMIPLSEPNRSQPAVAQWLTEALVNTFDFHFANVQQSLNKSSMAYFTLEGADALLQTWEQSGNYDTVVERELFVSLAITDTPLLVRYGIPPDSNLYVWRYQVPAIMTYRNRSQVFTNQVEFTVDVSRRSILENSQGLGISKIIMKVE